MTITGSADQRDLVITNKINRNSRNSGGRRGGGGGNNQGHVFI